MSSNLLALSLCPEEAVCYLSRVYKTLILTDPPLTLRTYRGRLLIHSLGFPDEPEVAVLCRQIMDEFGFDEDLFPAFAIQGSAWVTDVFPYTPQSFADDEPDHGYKEPLGEYAAKAGVKVSQTWGMRFAETCFLSEPIYDVIPPETVSNGSFWLPQTPSQLLAFQLAVTARDDNDDLS